MLSDWLKFELGDDGLAMTEYVALMKERTCTPEYAGGLELLAYMFTSKHSVWVFVDAP